MELEVRIKVCTRSIYMSFLTLAESLPFPARANSIQTIDAQEDAASPRIRGSTTEISKLKLHIQTYQCRLFLSAAPSPRTMYFRPHAHDASVFYGMFSPHMMQPAMASYPV